MYVDRHVISITTDSSGDATGYTPVVNGRVLAIRYVDTDLAATGDFTFTGEETGIAVAALVNAGGTSATWYPRVQSQDAAGAGVTFDGTNEIYEPPYIGEERIKLVVAQGGDTKSGTFHVLVG